MPFHIPRNIFLITGKTGAGKTRMLSLLAKDGEPVLFLEELAAHRGSAFGKNGIDTAVPSQDHFDQLIDSALANLAEFDYFFTEKKGRTLGKLQLPGFLNEPGSRIVIIELLTDEVRRIANLQEDYFSHPACMEEAENGLQKMKEKMPPALWKAADQYLQSADIPRFLQTMLRYYDKSLRYSPLSEPSLSLSIRNEADLVRAAREIKKFATRFIVPV